MSNLTPLSSAAGGYLYGTTLFGGAANQGVVFKVATDGSREVTLHSFASGNDGAQPYGGLVADKTGNLYGATSAGGANGNGTVYELSKGKEKVLYAFQSGTDARDPESTLSWNVDGELCGTSVGGGKQGEGTVFCVTTNGGARVSERVLYMFRAGSDGAQPFSELISDTAGNLYGTTYEGGTGGAGVIFKLAPDGTETPLYSFSGDDGSHPWTVISDGEGNLYGTTKNGGSMKKCGPQGGCGVVFELTADDTLRTLHAFKGGKDGAIPFDGLFRGPDGVLYGATIAGGGGDCSSQYNGAGCGIVFSLNK